MPKEKLYKRKWLNDEEGTAFVEIQMEQQSNTFSKKTGAWGCITIKDCTRQCSLEMDYYDEKDYKQRLRKIRRLRKLINEVEDWMVAHPPVDIPEDENKKEEE